MGKLNEKVAIITGGGAGIGKQMAIRFAEDGANLALCDINLAALEETAKICEEKGAKVLCFRADIKNKDDLEGFVNKTVETFGTIDILVNNAHGGPLPESASVQAGYSETIPFADTPISHFQHFIEGNLYSTINMMQLCFPYMKGKKDASVINYSSCSSKGMHGIGEGRYALGTAKGAVAVLSQMVAHEWGQYGIRVNVIYPAAVTDTQMANLKDSGLYEAVLPKLQDNPMRHAGDPYEDIAPVASFLASEDSKFITGSAFYANGGNWMSI